MRYGTNTNLSSLLDQKVDILQLMHDEDSTAYAWTIRKTCPAYGNIMDAMEDFAIVFEVSPSVIAA